MVSTSPAEGPASTSTVRGSSLTVTADRMRAVQIQEVWTRAELAVRAGLNLRTLAKILACDESVSAHSRLKAEALIARYWGRPRSGEGY